MNPLWTFHDLLQAIQGHSIGIVPQGFVNGISIDSRSIAPQEAFFCYQGSSL